jgi:dCTP deaminase
MILSAQSIRKRVGMIVPFTERSVFMGMTYGLGPAGYDVLIAENKIIRPGEFFLASTVEHFSMPNDVVAMVKDKSSWARKGIVLQNTVIEPGWRGYLTLEITHHGEQAITLTRGMPIAQIVFMQMDEPTEIPYNGKYQDQKAGAQEAIEEK